MNLTDEVLEAIAARYPNPDELADMTWMIEVARARPYEGLVTELRRRFSLVEATDHNDDYSFVYEIAYAGGPKWSLYISFLGPYCLLARQYFRPYAETIVDGETDCRNPEERSISETCKRWGVKMVTREIAGIRCAVQLRPPAPAHAPREVVRLFHVLFQDATDVLPGEGIPSLRQD